MRKEIGKDRLKVFLEDARMVTDEEIVQLPPEKRKAASGKNGLWVEVACPDGACSLEQDRITLNAGGVIPKETKGIWLSLFCPQNYCSIETSTDLP